MIGKCRFLSFAILVLLCRNVASTGTQRCSLSLNRVLGRLNNYVWVCNCLNQDNVTETSARSQVNAPTGEADSAAKARAFLRCTTRAEDRLLQTCLKDRRLFEQNAKHTMKRCLREPLSQEDRQVTGRFQFDRSRCEATLRRFVAGEITAGVWLCDCLQPDGEFRVVPGRAQFQTNGSPVGARNELAFLERCTGDENRMELERVCRETPGDFELLALQLMQVCCKRARVMFDEKFECAALVPDDVSPLKVLI